MERRSLGVLLVPAFALTCAACDVQREQQGELPEVNVEGGELPEYQVETGDVDVGQDTVTVPEVRIEEPSEPGATQPR